MCHVNALKCFEECDPVYLVANINGDEGRSVAVFDNVPHVRLLLLDGAGQLKTTIRGLLDHDHLKPRFEALAT